MIISELIKELEAAKNLKGDVEVCISIDEEGNDFKPIWSVDAKGGNVESNRGKQYSVVIWPEG
jgi:hypothetical protein